MPIPTPDVNDFTGDQVTKASLRSSLAGLIGWLIEQVNNIATTSATAAATIAIATLKDVSNGFPGMTGYAINLFNSAKTFKSLLTFAGTADRIHTFPDYDGDLATLAGAETLTNKTLTSPVINTPTGIIKADIGLGNVDNTSDANKPVSTAQNSAISLKQDASNKDASGGYVGLTLFKMNFKNAANTFTNFFTNATTAARTYTFPDKDITVAGIADITGTNSGTNTGDQTTVTGNAGTATSLQTARNIDGQAFDGSAAITVIAPGTHAASSKATPIDADEIPLIDSAATFALKRLTWADIKATLLAYFNGVYALKGANSDITSLTGLTTPLTIAQGGTGTSLAPAFSAYQSIAQQLTGSFTLMNFQTEEFDTNNNFTASRFTPTVAGYYQFNAHAVITGGGYVILAIFKNGAAFKSGDNTTIGGNNSGCGLNAFVFLNGTTDYVGIYGATTGGICFANSADTYFQGFLARAA